MGGKRRRLERAWCLRSGYCGRGWSRPRHAFDAGQLTFAGGTADLADRAAFTRFLSRLRAIDWVLYAKRPFGGPEQVLEYLGRYTHRVALSNNRLVSLDEGVVRFQWKDYADHDRRKVMALAVDEFLRRFLLHVLPGGFMRIRHFGLLANRTRHATIARCRQLLDQPPPSADTGILSSHDLMRRLTGLDLTRCPVCGLGHMGPSVLLAPLRSIPLSPSYPDTS